MSSIAISNAVPTGTFRELAFHRTVQLLERRDTIDPRCVHEECWCPTVELGLDPVQFEQDLENPSVLASIDSERPFALDALVRSSCHCAVGARANLARIRERTRYDCRVRRLREPNEPEGSNPSHEAAFELPRSKVRLETRHLPRALNERAQDAARAALAAERQGVPREIVIFEFSLPCKEQKPILPVFSDTPRGKARRDRCKLCRTAKRILAHAP